MSDTQNTTKFKIPLLHCIIRIEQHKKNVPFQSHLFKQNHTLRVISSKSELVLIIFVSSLVQPHNSIATFIIVASHIYPPVIGQRQTPNIGRSAHFNCNDYFVIGGIRTRSGVSSDPMFLWISSNSCPLILLLVRSHQAEIMTVKRLIQRRNNVIRVRVEPRSCDQDHRKNDAFTLSARLPNIQTFLHYR